MDVIKAAILPPTCCNNPFLPWNIPIPLISQPSFNKKIVFCGVLFHLCCCCGFRPPTWCFAFHLAHKTNAIIQSSSSRPSLGSFFLNCSALNSGFAQFIRTIILTSNKQAESESRRTSITSMASPPHHQPTCMRTLKCKVPPPAPLAANLISYTQM